MKRLCRSIAIIGLLILLLPMYSNAKCTEQSPCPELARLSTGISVGGVPAAASTIWFSDTFTEASNQPLENHTPETGTQWSAVSGFNVSNFDVDATNDELTMDSADSKYALFTDTSPSANYYVKANGKTGTGGRVGVLARFVDDDNMYYGYLNGDGEVRLYKKVGGSWSAIDADCAGTVTIAGFNTGTYYTIKIVVNGDTVELYIDDVLKCDGTAGDLDLAYKAGVNLATTNGRITSCEAGGL